MRLGRISKRTLSFLITDVEQHRRVLPRSLRSMLYDLYSGAVRGFQQECNFWCYVGTDGFTVARLRTGQTFTVERIDLGRAQDEGRDLGELIDSAFRRLRDRHRQALTPLRVWSGTAVNNATLRFVT